MAKAKVIPLHQHQHVGALRQLHVAFLLTVCERITLGGVRAVVRNLLLDAGASDGAIKSVTVAPAPRKGGAAR